MEYKEFLDTKRKTFIESGFELNESDFNKDLKDFQKYGIKTALFKGRLDWGLKDIAVIDLKVTAENNFRSVINHMGYDNQLFGYCGAYGVKLGYILIYSSTTDKYDLIQMPLDGEQFWKEKIMKFGTVK